MKLYIIEQIYVIERKKEKWPLISEQGCIKKIKKELKPKLLELKQKYTGSIFEIGTYNLERIDQNET